MKARKSHSAMLAITGAIANARCWIVGTVAALLAATATFLLAAIPGQRSSIDPKFLNRISVLTAGIAVFVLVPINKEVLDKFNAALVNSPHNSASGDSSAGDQSNEDFVPGQCGKLGCRKMARTGARACREHLCRFCQTGWQEFLFSCLARCRLCPKSCTACQWKFLMGAGMTFIGVCLALWLDMLSRALNA